MFQRAAVSEHGVLAWICRGSVFVITLEYVMPVHRRFLANCRSTQEMPILLSNQVDQNFTDISFNDTGEKLFAWAYGQTDSLYIWRCHERLINPDTESESHYETVSDEWTFE